MTTLNLSALRKRAEEAAKRAAKASPAPWTRWKGHPTQVFSGEVLENTKTRMSGASQVCETDDYDSVKQARLNSKFIAAARTDVPALSADVVALVARVERCHLLLRNAYEQQCLSVELLNAIDAEVPR